MRSVCSRFHCAALAGCLLLGAASSDAQPQVRQVLLLQSFPRGILTLDSFTANFRVDLEERSGTPVNVVQIVVNPTGLVGTPEQAVVDYVHATFADRPQPDLIVTLGVVSGDPVLLQQVLVNLVMNAMDAMAETPPGRRLVTIHTAARTDDVEVSVRDAGAGLPTRSDDRLFAPFATTKTHGLGIGLTIARTIVDAHDGTIEAHDNPEGGATFTVRLRRIHDAGVVSRQSVAS